MKRARAIMKRLWLVFSVAWFMWALYIDYTLYERYWYWQPPTIRGFLKHKLDRPLGLLLPFIVPVIWMTGRYILTGRFTKERTDIRAASPHRPAIEPNAQQEKA